MKIGYPCINRSIGCTANHTFRLAGYSGERFIDTVENNLNCLQRILEYNVKRGILFFRISSDVVPFASHPVCKVPWRLIFSSRFKALGRFIKENNIRISMHPDQFVLLNAEKPEIFKNSLKELAYHSSFLDALGLDFSAKIQIHVGGVYGNRKQSMLRFIKKYRSLPARVKNRLVIENDDSRFTLADCISIHRETGVPVLFDNLHHACLNRGESETEALQAAMKTWKKRDGPPMTDYSSQQYGARRGKHAESINISNFKAYLNRIGVYDIDIMLEIKDKEQSAVRVIKALSATGAPRSPVTLRGPAEP